MCVVWLKDQQNCDIKGEVNARIMAAFTYLNKEAGISCKSFQQSYLEAVVVVSGNIFE